MNKNLCKKLYNKFEHFKDPIIIRQKIKEYNEELKLKRHKTIIKNYKENKLYLQNEFKEISDRIDFLKEYNQVINNNLKNKDFKYYIENVFHYDYNVYKNILTDLRKLDIEYNYSKFWIKMYLENKNIQGEYK